MSPEERQRIRNAAADLLEAKGWAQGYYAYNARGEQVSYDEPSACTFCLRGALYAVTGSMTLSDRALPEGDLVRWNDAPGRTAAEVIAFLRSGKDRPDAEEGA